MDEVNASILAPSGVLSGAYVSQLEEGQPVTY
ncbi:MAG: hypothetical protein Ct9H90mP23_2230 [Methanobacteriota archaeon]|nr:MAG: hypothetical protein Ct9H90mP23_2230 [Euryarchaeota archaeon]